MREDFFINGTISVKPSINIITESGKKEVRVEQRVMQVLSMLAETPRQIVLREKIITEVWNDYGGADEGLNQVISILRKTLNDTDKSLIETVPKKGYVLNATISKEKQITSEESKEITVQENLPPTTNKTLNQRIKYIVTSIVLLILIIAVCFSIRKRLTSPDIYNSNNTEQQAGDTILNRGADVVPDSLHK